MEMKELARAYVKIQEYTKRWPPMEALVKGTIFPELYRPYEHGGRDPYGSPRTGRKGGKLRG